MAEAALPKLPSVDGKTVMSVIAAVVILVVIYLVYMHFWGSKPKPAGALSADEYGKLSAADQALYKKGDDGWYVKA